MVLDLGGVESVDVSFVQLVVSAALTAERAGLGFVVSALSPVAAAAFGAAGVRVAAGTGRVGV